MKRYLTLSIFLILSLNLFAGTNATKKYQLSGTVIDGETKQLLEYATISVFDMEGKAVSGAITDADGKFAIKIDEGTYQIKVQFISYTTHEQEIKLNSDLDLGTLSISPDKVLLDDVEIVDEKTQVELELDKKVYNIGKDITAQGGTVNDVLNNVPSVAVDPSGAISLRGNGGVQVLINGKPSVIAANNGLEGIPAQNVDRIEVVTNPSARYQAAGTAGIINIVLKKNKLKGIGGSVQLATGIPADHNANLNLNYKNDKVNLFGSIGRRYSNYNGRLSNLQTVNQNGTTTVLNQIGDQDRNDNAYNFFLGSDLYFNERNTMTASFFRFYTENTDVTIFDYDYDLGSGSTDSTVQRTIDYYEPQKYNQLEVNYTKTFKKPRQRWVIDFQYDFWNDDENENILNAFSGENVSGSTEFRTRDIESSDDFMLSSDYVHPIGEKGRIETGFRAETRVITSNYLAEQRILDDWEVFQGLDNDVDYSERIGGAYFQYGNSAGKFSYLLGLRSEYTEIEINDARGEFSTTKDYLRFFPTAHFNYNHSKSSKAQLSYSRRIRRPGFWQLNPFGGFADNNAIFRGNPDLDPAYTNSLELAYLLNTQKLSFNPSLYFQQTTDYFQFYSQQLSPEDGGGSLTTPINLDAEYRYGVEIISNYRPKRWLQLTGEFNYYQFRQRGDYFEISSQDTINFDFNNDTWSAEIGTRLRLPKGINFQANFQYQGRNQNAQTLNRSVYAGRLGISKLLLKEKGTLSFNINNIFDSQVQRYLTVLGDSFSSETERARIKRRYRVSFSYRFNRSPNDRDRRPGRSNR